MAKQVRMVVVLLVISLLSAAILAVTYDFTYAKIQETAEKKQNSAVFEVLPDIKEYREFKNDAEMVMLEGMDSSGSVTGLAYIVQGAGFGGPIKVMVGLDIDSKTISGYRVLEHSETPGLGAMIADPSFMDQFSGKEWDDPFVVNQDVDSITGATVSSESFTKLLKESIDKALKVYGGEKQ